MIILKKFYFEPNNFTGKIIDPIIFDKGLNFIIGEKTENSKGTNKKMNSVGKSLLIEMIDFCLLKDSDKSRVNKIPIITLNSTIYICLDFEIETENEIKKVTIKRNRDDSLPIIVICDNSEKTFEKVAEAREYIEHLVFTKIENRPSFRNLLSILIRDEKTIYDSVIKSSPGTRNYTDLIKPHLYLFGFDIAGIETLKNNFKKFDKLKESSSQINNGLKMAGIDSKKIKSYLNELQDKVEKLNLAVDELKPSESIKQKNNELNNLEISLNKVMDELCAKDYAIERIKRLPKIEKINTDDLKVIYNQYKLGLGDLVKKSLDQVTEFKNEIDSFQHDLMTKKLKNLQEESRILEDKRKELDNKISKIYQANKAKEKIESLRDAVAKHKEKNDELASLSEKYKLLEEYEESKKSIKKANIEILDKLDVRLHELSNELAEFENDLKNIHEYIAGNKECHFDIKTKETSKEYINIDYRVNLDGGAGINRIRTFIYDILLMVNSFTSKKHLGFLIHDNIFASAGKDDMVKSLNYLNSEENKGKKFQYIVTINKDEFDSVVTEFDFDYKDKVKITLTRNDQLLKITYREV